MSPPSVTSEVAITRLRPWGLTHGGCAADFTMTMIMTLPGRQMPQCDCPRDQFGVYTGVQALDIARVNQIASFFFSKFLSWLMVSLRDLIILFVSVLLPLAIGSDGYSLTTAANTPSRSHDATRPIDPNVAGRPSALSRQLPSPPRTLHHLETRTDCSNELTVPAGHRQGAAAAAIWIAPYGKLE